MGDFIFLFFFTFRSLVLADFLEDCYTEVFNNCDSIDDTDPCVAKGLRACRSEPRPRNQPTPSRTQAADTEELDDRSCALICKDLGSSQRKYKEAVNRDDLDAMDSYHQRIQWLKEKAKDAQCQCPSESPPASRPVIVSYNLAGNHSIKLMSSCKKYEGQLRSKIEKALKRFEECLQYAYIKPDLARMMVEAIQGEGILIDCVPPPQVGKCAAAGEGIGLIAIAPKALTTGVCPDIEDIIIHEIAHTANLESELPSPPGRHNYGERADMYDEVYGISKLCMTPARMWINRRRAGDVVQKGKLDCVRRYMEETPRTLVDPFWIPMKQALQAGRDPCPE